MAPEKNVWLTGQRDGFYDFTRNLPNESACRHVATGLNNAVVTKRDTCAGIGSEQATLANGHYLLTATGKCAHDRRPAADIRAIADYNACADPSLHH